MKYKTLRDLQAAYKDGTLNGKDSALWLDNDHTSVYDGEHSVFEMHPALLLEEALDLLGIPWEHV